MIYVREDIPSKKLTKHQFTKNVEGMFLEMNLRKSKLLFFGGYRSEHEVHGLSKEGFLEQMSFALDKYSNYDKTLLAGDISIWIGKKRFSRTFYLNKISRIWVERKPVLKALLTPVALIYFSLAHL